MYLNGSDSCKFNDVDYQASVERVTSFLPSELTSVEPL